MWLHPIIPDTLKKKKKEIKLLSKTALELRSRTK